MTISEMTHGLVEDYRKTVLGFCLAYEAANPYATEGDKLQALEDAFKIKEDHCGPRKVSKRQRGLAALCGPRGPATTPRGDDARTSRRFVRGVK